MKMIVNLLMVAGLCSCKVDRTTQAEKAAPRASESMTAIAKPEAVKPNMIQRWYDETKELYYRIPVRVSYFPEDPEVTRKVWAALEHYDDVFNDFKEGWPDSVAIWKAFISSLLRNCKSAPAAMSFWTTPFCALAAASIRAVLPALFLAFTSPRRASKNSIISGLLASTASSNKLLPAAVLSARLAPSSANRRTILK